MSIPIRIPSKPTLFAILMVASALLAIMPSTWTNLLDGLIQPLGWLSAPVSHATRAARNNVDKTDSHPPTVEDFDRLRRENERLSRQVGHQQIQLAELDQMVANLTGLRDQLLDLDAMIIVAPVIGGDTSPRRETITIGKGSRHGVKIGDWVAAGLPKQERSPAVTARDPLLRQWLVGRVREVQPHLSRIQLATDPDFGHGGGGPVRAWAAKSLPDGTWGVSDTECLLVGAGNRLMRIDRVPWNYQAAGQTIVLVPLAHPRPMALAIGRIVKSETLETGLHYNFTVEPWGDPRRLSRVYVISLGHQ